MFTRLKELANGQSKTGGGEQEVEGGGSRLTMEVYSGVSAKSVKMLKCRNAEMPKYVDAFYY